MAREGEWLMAFQINRRGMAEMLVMPGMLADMGRRANLVAAKARADGPVDEDGPHPGEYVNGIEVTVLVRPKSEDPPRAKRREARACGRVTATATHSAHVEFGDERRPGTHNLRNSLSAAGD